MVSHIKQRNYVVTDKMQITRMSILTLDSYNFSVPCTRLERSDGCIGFSANNLSFLLINSFSFD